MALQSGFSTSRSYDGVGTVTSAQTTLAAGSDSQAFCYDEQNRLTWASSQTGTGPCGAQNTAGTLNTQGSQYTASYAYDALNRLTSSPLGSYAYASGHLHAASSVTSGSSTVYSAQYGTVGSMYCRAASSSSTCEGSTFSGARMGYDHEGRLISWQNTWSSPTQTAAYAYDGAGQRVAQSVTNGSPGTTSTTYYVGGGLEELTVSGTTSTLTKYESVPGVCNVVIVGTGPSESISYVTTDGLGSVSEALDGSGHVTAQQLYGPYGGARYSSGTMPTAKGFTGQYADAASSGLDYYNARYYDPTLGQFTSADTDAKGGLNRYAYVGGNPETATDPSGHLVCGGDVGTCSGGNGRGSGGSSGSHGGKKVVGTTKSAPIINTTLNSDYTTTITTTILITITYSDGSTKTYQDVSSRTVCDATCHQKQSDQAKGDITKMVVGGAGVLLGLGFVVATLMNFGQLESVAWIAAAFGGNPLSALFAELALVFASASYLLSAADDYLHMTGQGNSSVEQQVDEIKTSMDALATITALAAAATSLGSASLGVIFGSLGKAAAASSSAVAIIGGIMAGTIGSDQVHSDEADAP